MKPFQTALQWLFWTSMTVFIVVVIAIGALTNITLRSLEKHLPSVLLEEINDLAIALEHLSGAVAAAELSRVSPDRRHIARLNREVELLYDTMVELREGYVFDNMVQASAFHAAVAPAVTDVRIWLVEGISGHGLGTPAAMAIIQLRLADAYEKAKALNRASHRTAHQILEQQYKRLDRFLFSVNLLFAATGAMTGLLVLLLIRQQRIRHRETQSLAALREIQQSLQESEELHRKLIATLPDIVIRTDMDGTIRFANALALQVTGYQPAEILGQNMMNFLAPEDQPRAIENTIRMVEEPLGPRSYRLVLKDGSQRLFEVNGDVLRRPDGTPYGLVQACRDISERQRLLDERHKLQERLHRAEKMEALGTLAGGVAHDLNNVLGVLVGYSELMLMEIPEGHPLRKHVTNILDSGQRGAAIIQDLLTLARRGVPVSEVVDLNALIIDSLRTPEYQKLGAAFPDIRIQTRLEKVLLGIKGSPVHLSKAIMNLVFNAVESIDGCGEVVIRTENRHLDRTREGYEPMAAGDYVVVSVTDTGTGIAEADWEKIFEPFYTKKVMGRSGTGLGLAVVWGAVKDHGGYVEVQSRIGRGTTFTLYFPATHEVPETPRVPVPVSRFAGEGELILVVDDVAAQRELACRMLERLGYRVHAVPSGEAAVAYLQGERQVDLVVLDMIMDPGMDGLDTYRRIRDIRPSQKTIIVSGYSETDRVKTAQAMGAGPYVRKPYLLERFGMAVRTTLDGA